MEITEFVKLRKEALAQEIKAMERPPHLMIILAK